MDTEKTIPDDLEGMLEEDTASVEPTAETTSQDRSGEDTGETGEVQAEAVEGSSAVSKETAADTAPAAPKNPELDWPEWLQQISRYHNDMNGLLAGKENLKVMAVNTSARPSFYKKWVYEANQFARLTVNLRHRKQRALRRLADETAKKETDSAA